MLCESETMKTIPPEGSPVLILPSSSDDVEDDSESEPLLELFVSCLCCVLLDLLKGFSL